MKHIRITRVRRVAADPSGVIGAALGTADASALARPDLELATSIARRAAGAMHAAGCDVARVEVVCGSAQDAATVTMSGAADRAAAMAAMYGTPASVCEEMAVEEAEFRPRPRGLSRCIESIIASLLFHSAPAPRIQWPPAPRRSPPLMHGDEGDARDWLRRRYPHNPRQHHYMPWGCLVAFARRHPKTIRDHAAAGSSLAGQLLAHIQAEDARDLMRRIAAREC